MIEGRWQMADGKRQREALLLLSASGGEQRFYQKGIALMVSVRSCGSTTASS
jgi:hypothetical protein